MNTTIQAKDIAPRPIAELISAPEEGRDDWVGRNKARTSNTGLRRQVFGRRA